MRNHWLYFFLVRSLCGGKLPKSRIVPSSLFFLGGMTAKRAAQQGNIQVGERKIVLKWIMATKISELGEWGWWAWGLMLSLFFFAELETLPLQNKEQSSNLFFLFVIFMSNWHLPRRKTACFSINHGVVSVCVPISKASGETPRYAAWYRWGGIGLTNEALPQVRQA